MTMTAERANATAPRRRHGLRPFLMIGALALWPAFAAAQSKIVVNPNAESGPSFSSQTEIRIALPPQLLMTRDESLVEVAFEIVWLAADAAAVQAQIVDPEALIEALAAAAMRDAVAATPLADALTRDRQGLADAVTRDVQRALDDYGVEATILRVVLDRVDPPAETIDAFRSVQAAEQDAEVMLMRAERDHERRVHEARRRAEEIIAAAEAEQADQLIAARAEAARFRALADGYRAAPDDESRALYVETLRLMPAE